MAPTGQEHNMYLAQLGLGGRMIAEIKKSELGGSVVADIPKPYVAYNFFDNIKFFDKTTKNIFYFYSTKLQCGFF